jgi:hypothetical protein
MKNQNYSILSNLSFLCSQTKSKQNQKIQKISNLRARRTRIFFLISIGYRTFFYCYESKSLVAIKSVKWSPQVLVVFIWNTLVTYKNDILLTFLKDIVNFVLSKSIFWQVDGAD